MAGAAAGRRQPWALTRQQLIKRGGKARRRIEGLLKSVDVKSIQVKEGKLVKSNSLKSISSGRVHHGFLLLYSHCGLLRDERGAVGGRGEDFEGL